MVPDDVTLARLEDQIAWYDNQSGYNKRMFKLLKITMVISAAVVPLLAAYPALAWFTALAGVLVVVIESIQQINQYHANWLAYRSTAESLKHEKYLHAANAGSYGTAANPKAMLAERVEALVSQQHAKWVSFQEAATKKAVTAEV